VYRWLFLILNIPLFCQGQSPACDLLITNGKIVDGTGNSWYYGDVAIKDDKIIAIGKLDSFKAIRRIDVNKQVIAPGFIDVHTHIEGDELLHPEASNFIYDGVTTVITGNCGSSELPIGNYLKRLDSVHLSINVASLVGHGNVRQMVMGNANRNPTKEELDRMKSLVKQAMQDGAVGFSTGLIYVPGTYAKTDELIELAAVAARYGGVYASHIRDEGDSVVQAVKEAIQIGRVNMMSVQVSHYKISGQHNWGRSKETIPLIIQARSEGIDVTIDQYPYTASSTSLSTLLPDDLLADGKDSVNARLRRPDVRKKTIGHLLARLTKRKLSNYSYTVIANYPYDTSLNGLSIEEANLQLGRKHTAEQEADLIINMILNGGAGMIFHGMSEDDVRNIMMYPYNMIASDAGIRIPGKGNPHPRGYGTNARVLSKYVREEKIISLEEAIRRMTSLPAQKFRLTGRGLLLPGMFADIVVFDPEQVKDLSSFDQPHQYSKGFSYVIVNGKLTIEQGQHNGMRAGVLIKGNGYKSSGKN
jgi:N-acyl-D-amino-acid deacylase